MTPADRTALIVAAKSRATPVTSCVRAGIRISHLTQDLDRDGLHALIIVLAECASPQRLKAVTQAPGDEGMPPLDRAAMLRAAHAERTRLDRAGLPVPFHVRALAAEYRQAVNARYRERKKNAATREDRDAA